MCKRRQAASRPGFVRSTDMKDKTGLPRTSPPLIAGDVLTALQVVMEHADEAGWEAVRLSRPNMRPWTGVRLGKASDIAVFSRVTAAGRLPCRSVQFDRLILIRRGSGPQGMSLRTSFGLAVRRLREQQGIAPKDFGDRVGLDWRILAGMERGDYQVYLNNIEQIADALDVTPGELMRLAEEARGRWVRCPRTPGRRGAGTQCSQARSGAISNVGEFDSQWRVWRTTAG